MIVGNDCCKECGLPLDGKGSCYPCDWHDPDAPCAQGEPRAASESTQKDTAMSDICGCGMIMQHPQEYHPYAACLMFRACKSSAVVRANLDAVVEHGREIERARWIEIQSANGDGAPLRASPR